MIEVTVAYPAGQGRTFNMDYYLETYIPLFQKRMGAAMKTIRSITRNWRQYAEVTRVFLGRY